MKSLFTSAVLVSFIGIAVFGIFGMHAGMQNHNDGCIAATAQGTDCPRQADLIDYLTFHLNAFQNFSAATVSTITFSLLILSLLVVGAAFGASLRSLALPKLAPHRVGWSDPFRPPSQYGLIHWLALHENSPAAP